MNVLFVIAHQDDEIALASRLRAAVAAGHQVTCICLTDGASRVSAATRDAESRHVLLRLGVTDFRLAAPHERIADGTLAEHLDAALEFVEKSIEHVDEVVTLAWEGGHHDHDAAHLVAVVFAARRGVPCIEMPLYNGWRTRGPLFRVNDPPGTEWCIRSLPWREYASNILLARLYSSQRGTWLGLAPLYFLGRPRELTRVADLKRAFAPPHPRPLLYERRFHYSYETFARCAATFLRQRSVPD
jgi:hypothetical protein